MLEFNLDFSDKLGLGKGVLSKQSTVDPLLSTTKSSLSVEAPLFNDIFFPNDGQLNNAIIDLTLEEFKDC